MANKTSAYTDAEISRHLAALPEWRYENGALRRVYKTKGFTPALMLANAIGYHAELADHHPDLTVAWGRLDVALSTHSAGGITEKDFEMARKIEEIAVVPSRQ
jgi:4a-hydroxytetrahydrobiopterin dehydratase